MRLFSELNLRKTDDLMMIKLICVMIVFNKNPFNK
jgi:hypothetical protein